MNVAIQTIFSDLEKRKYFLYDTLFDWCQINTGTFNLDGQLKFQHMIRDRIKDLTGHISIKHCDPYEDIEYPGTIVSKPLAPVLLYRVRPKSKFKILLGIHQDTVFGMNHSFQQSKFKGKNILHAPGSADAKGGLLVALTVLEYLESLPGIKKIGYTLFINADEEIGSPGSLNILKDLASEHRIGLLFEPSLEDGSLVQSRGGSGKFTFKIKGKSAHVGRNFNEGISAIKTFNTFFENIKSQILRECPEAIINLGVFQGGSSLNCVPESALAKVNIRPNSLNEMKIIQKIIRQSIQSHNTHIKTSGQILCSGSFHCPPKILDRSTKKLIHLISHSSRQLGFQCHFKHSGGVSDGNKLSFFGCPNIDTLGVQGKYIHTENECVYLSSVIDKIKLTLTLIHNMLQNL